MNIKEKFGQMIMLGLDVDTINDEIISLIKDYKIGGVVLYKKNYHDITSMKDLINKLKEINTNNIPLFIAVDQENGRVNRLPNEIERIYSAEKQTRTNNIEIVNECNNITAEILNNIGINMNLAPVLDINYDNSKVIGNRSYGKNKEEVIKYAIPSIKTYQSKGIIPVVKHFPGHGLANQDSHYLIPKINNVSQMKEDLTIYKEAIKEECDAIMIGHLKVKGYGQEPASINKRIIKKYLIDKYNYQGIIITDDLRMNIMQYVYGLKNIINKSINAGTNVLMIKYKPNDIKKLYNKLYKMIDKGIISNNLIEDNYNTIIKIKEKYKLNNNIISNKLDIDSINERINKVNKEIEKYL